MLKAIPVVDFENYWMDEYAQTKAFQGTKNSWEYFFEPLSNFGLGEVYNSANVTLSAGQRISENPLLSGKSCGWIFDPVLLSQVSDISNKFITLNSYLNERLENIKGDITWDSEYTLGVSLRGGNYEKYRYRNHAAQPNIDAGIEKVRQFLNSFDIRRIILQTHSVEYYQLFKSEFGDIMYPSVRHQNYSTLKHAQKNIARDRPYHWDSSPKQTLEANIRYLLEIWLLSQSAYFIASVANGSAFALAKNSGQFKEKFLFDEGLY